MKRIVVCTGLSVALGLIGFSLSFAKPNVSEESVSQSFEVRIRVFAGQQPAPAAEHQIAFDQGTIYLFPANAQEPITVIDPEGQLVILLDCTTSVHTAISTADLISMTASLRSSANNDALRKRMGIDANVETDSTGRYTVAYGDVQYATTTQQPVGEMWANQFGQFSDWASRLNIAQKRGLPPFGKMLMNSRIAADGLIPLETKLQVTQGNEIAEYRSTHEISSGLSNATRVKINEANTLLALSKGVTLSEFPQ